MTKHRIILDGSDWEADYFLSMDAYTSWTGRGRSLQNMLRLSAQAAGFHTGAPMPDAIKGTIPGCDRTFLLENGLCDEPYYGRNLEHTEWTEKYAWGFRRTFKVPKEWNGSRVILDFAGVDYSGYVFLNGVWLEEFEGMFQPLSIDVTEQLKFNEDNLLAVVFNPAPRGLANHKDKEASDFGKLHRTQIGFGWDWSRGIVPTGIWDSVSLTAYRHARVRDFLLHWDGQSATLELELESRCDQELPLQLKLSPATFKGKRASAKSTLRLTGGTNRVSISLPLPDDLQLWSANQGDDRAPALYDLNIELDGEPFHKTIGFRQVKTVRTPDSPEQANNLTFQVNGQNIFARGVNWVPSDLLASRITAADYEYLVATAAAAGINLFRIWGGGYIEKDSFYEACDRHGILVWQEFPHACTTTPKEIEFITVAARQGESIIRKLRNHPCMALFVGGNELQYYNELPDSPLLLKYGELVQKLTDGLSYRVSSPDKSRPGERHHGPWNFRSHADCNAHFRQLASEVGCNGMPEYESLRQFIPEKELKAGQGPSFDYHFFHHTAPHDLWKPVREWFGVDKIEQVCQASMMAQADVVQYQLEHYRRLFPRAAGCIHWQYNEPWPTGAWSTVDYYGRAKIAHYAMGHACQPVLLSLKDDSWACEGKKFTGEWFITCDHDFAGSASLTIIAGDGTVLYDHIQNGRWETGTFLLKKVSFGLPSHPTLLLALFRINGEYTSHRLYGCPDFKTAFRLPPTSLTISRIDKQGIAITNKGSVPAINVHLDFPKWAPKEYILSDDYLCLAPGETRRLKLLASPAASATAKIRLAGWNVPTMNCNL